MRTEYQEVVIQSVFNYFVDGFNMKDGEKVVHHESNYDPRTGKVIFKLYIAKPEEIAIKELL
jgi:hypothetical protein